MELDKLIFIKKLKGLQGKLTRVTPKQENLIRSNASNLDDDIIEKLFYEDERDSWTTYIVFGLLGGHLRLILWYNDDGKIREFVIAEQEVLPLIKLLSKDVMNHAILEKL